MNDEIDFGTIVDTFGQEVVDAAYHADQTARDSRLREDSEENSVRIRPVLPSQLPVTIPRVFEASARFREIVRSGRLPPTPSQNAVPEIFQFEGPRFPNYLLLNRPPPVPEPKRKGRGKGKRNPLSRQQQSEPPP